MKSACIVENGINRSTVTMDEDSIKFELEKLNLKYNDILIMKLPTDDDGDITCFYDEAFEYFKALKEVWYNVIALPSDYSLKAANIEELECYRDALQETIDLLKGRLNNERTI